MARQQPKINVDELIKSFKITNEEAFTAYLREIWLVCITYKHI